MSLTDATIRTAKPKNKPYKLFDGDGPFLFITPPQKKKGIVNTV